MRIRHRSSIEFLVTMLLVLCCWTLESSFAQQTGGKKASAEEQSLSDSVRQMQQQIQQLQTVVQELKEEAGHYREETVELRRELQVTREKLDLVVSARTPAGLQVEQKVSASATPQAQDSSSPDRIAKLADDVQLLNSKVDEQYQTKVESASKYRVRLSGMLLMNIFSNTGNPDHIEVPSVALPTTQSLTGGNTGGSFGATVRQSQIGLEVYGPTLAGAKTRGDFVVDFFGEFPEAPNQSSSGTFRVKTGTVRLDWARTSLVGGLDNLFVSPVYPTSFASLAVPALSYSGNLWAWAPQLRVEHRFTASENSTFTLSGGILDPLTGETPPNEFLRFPGAGEASRQPAYGTRLQWDRRVHDQSLMVGVGSYYSRQNWGFNRNVDGWAATLDWNIPLQKYFSVSGKFYRGRAIGGIGGGMGRSVVWDRPLSDPASVVRSIPSIGGWGQIKFKPAARLEFNAAAGEDDNTANAIRGFAATTGYFAANLNRNRSEFANFIYRPRSNLLFSTEFRTLRTFTVDGASQKANQLNLIMGVLF